MIYNYSNVKDKSKRIKFKLFEPINLILKSIIFNRNLNKDIRFLFYYKLIDLKKDISKTQIVNRCLITNKSHSVLRIFRLSRMSLRETIPKNIIQGVKKTSW